MRTVLALLFLVFTASTFSCHGLPSAASPVAPRSLAASPTFDLADAADAARRVLLPGGGGGSGVCVFLDPRDQLVLTAAHVVEGHDEVELRAEDDVARRAKVIYYDAEGDLAVLRAGPGASAGVAGLAARDAGYRWEPVLCYGYPALVGPDGHPTFGVVASERDVLAICVADHAADAMECQYEPRRFWRVTAPTFFGNSGGAVYVREPGRWALAGVSQRVIAGYNGVATHVGFSSPPAATRAAVDAAIFLLARQRAGGADGKR